MFGKREDNSGIESRISAIEVKIQSQEKELDKIDRLHEKLDSIYVRLEEFTPVKNVIYGFVGVVLLAVVGGILASIGLG